MNGVVTVQRIDQLEDIVLRRVLRERILYGVEAAGLGTALLVAHIHLACRILANNYHCQTWLNAVVSQQRGGLLRDGLSELFGLGLSVDTFCGHQNRSMYREKRAVG